VLGRSLVVAVLSASVLGGTAGAASARPMCDILFEAAGVRRRRTTTPS